MCGIGCGSMEPPVSPLLKHKLPLLATDKSNINAAVKQLSWVNLDTQECPILAKSIALDFPWTGWAGPGGFLMLSREGIPCQAR